MVQLMRSLGEKAAVKLEAEDCLEDQLSPPLHKRSKLDSSASQRPDGDVGVVYNDSKNPLEEPSPLGLRLKKSPSFLDLIQMKLSQESTSTSATLLSKKQTTTSSNSASVADKLKASNFPASLLKIGTWEYKSRYEGDLVAKCYFAKHKLVWEVLDGGLKNKIEIQWSDIVAIKANFSSEGPETLDVVLARQPLFFRETNPQPRKHTLWQATSDFTGGQASIHRRHFLQCQHGLMGKHFEKLIQCDPRLNFLSRQQEILLESPYFEQRVPAFGDLNESSKGLDPKAEGRSAVFALQDAGPPPGALPSGALSSSLNIECQGFMGRTPEHILQETPSPSFEIRGSRTEEQKLPNHWDQIKVHGIHSSMSMSDLVNRIGHCISEQMTSGNPALSGGEIKSDDILEEGTQYLLGDSQHASALDEQSLMSRVNSLCCLLQKDPGTVRDLQAKSHCHLIADNDEKPGVRNSTIGSASQRKSVEGFPAPESQSNNISSCKQAPAMSRKDSVGDLLLNLPRIASLPRFLFNI